jgi:sulfide dehydrogenase cytochrome subunit
MQNSIKVLVFTMAILLGLLQVPSGHAEELTRGAMLGASCDGCHGTDGHSPGSIPDISGKSAEFIRTSLEEFRSGERESTVMMRQAKGYTDEEMQLIAEYFAKRK